MRKNTGLCKRSLPASHGGRIPGFPGSDRQDASFPYIPFPGRKGESGIHGGEGGIPQPISSREGSFRGSPENEGPGPESGSVSPFLSEIPTTKDIITDSQTLPHIPCNRSIGHCEHDFGNRRNTLTACL